MRDDYIKEVIILKSKLEKLLDIINKTIANYYTSKKGLPEDINKLEIHLENYSNQLNKTNLN
jgi:Na+/phosphate symporter|tara:strand:+ start:1406 stop:1591 length:186 start_codon:yes stop_codon:yes gene_type:complete